MNFESVLLLNLETIILGDFNIDYLDNACNSHRLDFYHTLNETPWDTAFVFDDINDIADAWYCLFNNAIDEHAPLVTKRIKKRVKPQWLTDDITILINKRNDLFKRAKTTQSDHDWRQVKALRNKINQSINCAQQEYFKISLIENRNNPKRLW